MDFVSYDIEGSDFRRAGAASRSIKEHLKRIGADAEAIRRTMIAAYEAEMNVVIHSLGGRLEASINDSRIDIDVVDGGPGIADVEQAMLPGFSTASAEARALGFGAGMGLPNIKENSDRLRITSRVGEGTRVSLTVYLKPATPGSAGPVSLYASADRCRDCRACLAACPTHAMRVRDGRPSVLEHLCIDCAACIAACATGALTVRDEVYSLDAIPSREDTLLVVPPAVLAGCGADYPPREVMAALRRLGFAGVITSEPWEQALRDAVLTMAAQRAAAAAPAEAAANGAAATRRPAAADGDAQGGGPVSNTVRGPLIIPSCPAVVNFIELRFPSLAPLLAPFDSPWEAVQAACPDRPAAYVVSCPSQRSALLQHERPGGRQAEYVAPETVRQALMMELTAPGGPRTAVSAGGSASAEVQPGLPPAPAPGAGAGRDRPLTVTGMGHVRAVLEQLEDGLLEDVDVIEPYACEGGCFGSPLLSEDHHVAARRWARGRGAVWAGTEAGGGTTGGPGGEAVPAPAATPRRRPYTARPGIRLDADMGRAIEKLGRLQEIIRSLPGKDCGACGAPTCAAFAEDIVMERAGVELCPYVTAQGGAKEDQAS